jgi:O-antigen/teichoic acid export membrane protein
VRRYWKQARTLLLYFLIPGISAVTPLLVYPALTSRYGAAGFAAVAIAQSLGYAGSVIAELGWGVLGPQRVARADGANRESLYQSAIATKSIAIAIIAPLAAIAAFVIAIDFKPAAALLAFATVTMASSPSWYLVGANRPLTILWTEALPRMLLLSSAAFAIVLGAPLEVYGIITLLAVMVTLVLASRATRHRLIPGRAAFSRGGAVIRAQLPLTFGRTISVIYTSLPVAIVGIVNPPSVALFGAIERLMRMALSILGGVPSRLQSWIGVAHGQERVTRSRRSLLVNLALGVVCGMGFALVAPWVASIVFVGEIPIPFEIAALSGCVLASICVSRGFGLSLVAEGKANWIAAANVAAAIVGLATIFALAGALGAAGAILSELLAELAGLIVQAIILFFGYLWIGKNPQDDN